MKVWYQSLVKPSLFPSYHAALARMVDAFRDPGTRVEVHGVEDVGGLGKQYHYLEHLQTAQVLENVEKAVEQGYDGFVIGHFTDAGLREAREIADIPVAALGEASMLMACMMGKRFSLIGISEKSLRCIEDNVHAYGLAQRVAPSVAMKLGGPSSLEDALNDDAAFADVVAAFDEAAVLAQRQGGEVLIPAGGVAMAVQDKAGMHATAGGASVLNGIAAAIKSVETAVHMNRLMQGRFTSRASYYARPRQDEMAQIRRHYGERIYRTVKS